MPGTEAVPPDGETASDNWSASQQITRAIIALHKDFFGRGPVGGETYLHPDSVFVLLNEGHTRAEETLRGGDGGTEVASLRVITTAAIEEELNAVVERATGRSVVSFLSSSKQEPSLILYVFVLEPNDVLSGPGRSGSAR